MLLSVSLGLLLGCLLCYCTCDHVHQHPEAEHCKVANLNQIDVIVVGSELLPYIFVDCRAATSQPQSAEIRLYNTSSSLKLINSVVNLRDGTGIFSGLRLVGDAILEIYDSSSSSVVVPSSSGSKLEIWVDGVLIGEKEAIQIQPPEPKDQDPRSWSILNWQWWVLQQHPSASAQQILRNEYGLDASPCSIIETMWNVDQRTERGRKVLIKVTDQDYPNLEDETSMHDGHQHHDEIHVAPIPALGIAFLPKETFMLKRILSTIDFAVNHIAISLDGSMPDNIWGKCWGEYVKNEIENHPNIVLFQEDRRRGCSANWNKVINNSLAVADWVLIPNADTFFRPGDLRRISHATHERYKMDPNVGIVQYPFEARYGQFTSFSCFAISKKTVEKVGYFDENMFPNYCEDDDYMIRMDLASLHRFVVPNNEIQVRHGREWYLPAYDETKTPKIPDPDRISLYTAFVVNRRYEKFKWGFKGEGCAFQSPFNGSGLKLDYWRVDPKRIQCIIDQNQDITNAGHVQSCDFSLNDEEKAKISSDTTFRFWRYVEHGWNPQC